MDLIACLYLDRDYGRITNQMLVDCRLDRGLYLLERTINRMPHRRWVVDPKGPVPFVVAEDKNSSVRVRECCDLGCIVHRRPEEGRRMTELNMLALDSLVEQAWTSAVLSVMALEFTATDAKPPPLQSRESRRE